MSHPATVAVLTRLSRAAAFFSALVGAAVLIAWQFGSAILITAGSSRKGMARGTAAALLLSGISLLVLNGKNRDGWRKWLGIGAAALAMALGATPFLRLLGILPASLDENLIFRPLSVGSTQLHVQMSPNSGLCLVLVGVALFSMNANVGRSRLGQWCALASAAVSLAACVGYAYDDTALYMIAGYSQMAAHSALTILILSVGILFARPRDGLMAFFSQDGPVGRLSRRLLPAAIAAPILSGWLRLQGQRAGWYGTETGLILHVTANVIFLLFFLYFAMTSRAVAEEKFRGLLEGAPEPMVIANEQGKIVLANTLTEKLFGYSGEELLGMQVEELVPERFRGKHTGHRDRYSRSPQTRPMGSGLELYARRKDGTEFPVEVSLAQMRTDEGLLVSSAIRDITERKRAEELLRESEERFRVALKSAPVVVFNQDLNLRYTWINSPVLAWAESAYLGRTDAEIVGGEEGVRLTAIKQGVLDTGVGTRVETGVTFQGQRHDFDLTVEPLRNAGGDILGITCASVDVTPIKQGAAERERLIRELQEALAQVKVLRGLLPICASCKKIRDERGEWSPVESYIRDHSEANFSHGICPECARHLYPELSLK